MEGMGRMGKLLALPEVLALTRISYPTINRWLKAGLFPQPINGRGRKLLWTQASIEQWMSRPVAPMGNVAAVFARQRRREEKEFERRQEAARQALEQHGIDRKPR